MTRSSYGALQPISASLHTGFRLHILEFRGRLQPVENLRDMLPFSDRIVLRVEEGHIEGSVTGSLLRFDWARADFLAPSDVQPAECVHSETFEVDADRLSRWAKNVLLKVAVVEESTVLPLKDEFVRRAARSISEQFIG